MRILSRRAAAVAALVTALCALALPGCRESSSENKDEGGDGTWETTRRGRPSGYVETVVRVKPFAEQQKCKARLGGLHRAMKRYAMANDTFPPSLSKLVSSGFASKAQRKCPGRLRGEYAYLGGQRESMDADNVVLYEPDRSHNGQCHVLRLNGAVELLAPEDAEAAVEATRERLRTR